MASSTSSSSVDPVDRLLDLFLYAPIGLVSKSTDALPDLIERGRSRAANARVIGQFAMGATNTKARQAVADAEQHIATFLRIVADSSSPRRAAASDSDPASAAPYPAQSTATAEHPRGVDDVIPGYADMTAAQILPLLAELSDEQRQRIEAFERSARSRKTVLNRLRQLNG